MKIYINLFKYFTFVAISIMLLNGCEIDEGLDGSISGETIYSTENGANQGLDGIMGLYYNSFQGGPLIKDYLTVFTGADDISSTTGQNKWYYRQADQFDRSSANSYVMNFYENAYKCVGACNEFIDFMDEDAWSDKIDKYRYFIGCARFIRAITYFNLTRTFNEIAMPISSEIDTEMAKSSQVQVLSQVIDDLKYAAAYVYNEQRDKKENVAAHNINGRPSKHAAWAYIAKAYMAIDGYPSNQKSNANWDMVKAYTDSIINEGVYTLLDDYAENFGYKGKTLFGSISQQDWEGNEEAIWSLIGQQDYSGAGRGTQIRWFGDPWFGWKDFVVEWNFYNNTYRKDDYRGKFSITADANWPYMGFSKFDFAIGQKHPLVMKHQWGGVTGSAFKVWTNTPKRNPVPERFGGYEHQYEQSNDLPIIRYAEVLLMNAEANARLGNTSDAIEKLNWVRRRAYAAGVSHYFEAIADSIASGYISSGYWKLDNSITNVNDYPKLASDTDNSIEGNALLTAIVNERASEFVAELGGVRWFDLVRLEKVSDYSRAADDPLEIPIIGSSADKGQWFFPLPSLEGAYNPNLR